MSANISTDLGAIFLGNLAAGILYGITCVQAFTYYQSFDTDHQALKLAVLLLWILDTLQLALVTYYVYSFAVSDWCNVKALHLPTWTLLSQIIVTTISATVIRIIYGIRIWRLSNKNVYLTGAIALSALFIVGTSLTFSSESLRTGSFNSLNTNSYVLYMCLGASVVADSIIGSSLCVLLFRNRTEITRTNSLLNTLILYTVCTGMLTGIYTTILIVVYAGLPNRAVFAALFLSLGKMYLNALLASLNARFKLREESTACTIVLDTVQFRSPMPSDPPRKRHVEREGTSTHTSESFP